MRGKTRPFCLAKRVATSHSQVPLRSQGSLQAIVKDIVGGENHTVGIHQSHAESNGKTLDIATAVVFVLRDGKIVEGREFSEDTAQADEFWG